jgi:hypothetical protein
MPSCWLHGLLFALPILGFLPRFEFLTVFADEGSMFMVGFIWYALFSGCLLGRGSGRTEVAADDETDCLKSALQQSQGMDDGELQEPILEDSSCCCMDVLEPSPEFDENAFQANFDEPLPTQAEFDWVSSARSGEIKLTEDVYRAAVQWWFEQQRQDRFEWLSPEDQRLMSPIDASLHQGDVAKAHVLLEKVGQLDKMERDLQRSVAHTVGEAVPATTPLSRGPLSPTSATGQLRKAIESHMPPSDQVLTSPALPYWHMSWKHNRSGLAEHLFAGIRTQDRGTSSDELLEHCSSDNVRMEESIGNYRYMGA